VAFKKIEGLLLGRWFRHFISIAALCFAVTAIYKIGDGIGELDIVVNFISSPLKILLVSGAALLASFLRGERLFLLVNVYAPGGKRKFAYFAYFYGLMLAFTPARSAELMRFSFPGAIEKISFEKSLKIFSIEKIIDIFSVLLIAVTIFIGYWSGAILFLIGFVLCNVIGVRLLDKLVLWRIIAGALLLSLIPWILEGLTLFSVLHQFNLYDFSPLDVIGGFSTSSLVGALSFVPGGILVSEATFLRLLHTGSGNLFAIILIFRLIILTTNFFIGIITWLLLLLNNR